MTPTSGTATARMTVLEDRRHLRVDGESARAAGHPVERLTLKLEGSEEQVAVPAGSPTEPPVEAPAGTGDQHAFTATIDLADPELTGGTWTCYVETVTGAQLPLISALDAKGNTFLYPMITTARADIRPSVGGDGVLIVHVRPSASHAELAQVWPRDGAIAFSGCLWREPEGEPGVPTGTAQLVLIERDSHTETVTHAEVTGSEFSVSLGIDELPGGGHGDEPAREVFDLYLRLPGVSRDLRIGRHLDDIKNKKKVMVYPQQAVQQAAGHGGGVRSVRPFYTVANNLSIEAVRE